MYAVARAGGEVERKPVMVTIYGIDVIEVRLPDVELAVECGSGTYIRAIARDAGDALGVGGHLAALRRTHVGAHDVARAVSFDQLGDEDAVRAAMLSPADAVSHLARATVTADQRPALAHGRALTPSDDVPEGVPVAMLSEDGDLLAIGQRTGDRLQPRKVFA
jgi:tRNA pseudouridine55 synthase